MAYAADGAYAGQTAQVVAGAYTNSYAGTETTELFTVDLATGMLMLQIAAVTNASCRAAS